MKNKRIIFEITHPKHYHQFKNLIKELKDDNYILVLARNKDVVLDLLEDLDVPVQTYDLFGINLLAKLLLVPRLLLRYRKVYKLFKPDLIISRSSAYSAFVCRFMKSKTVIFPDSEVVVLTRKFVAPMSDLIITPQNYSVNYGDKHHRVSGFFEESYLGPDYFVPNENIFKKALGETKEKIFFLRFVSWQANHDVNQFGFNLEQKIMLVDFLSGFGKVLISSEKATEKELEPYRIGISPRDIHHILSRAWLYIGDSQSMATEAALLGVPSLRYNSFVGENDMSNFIKLEKEHDLLYNFNDFNKLFDKIREMMNNPNLKEEWIKKRKLYFERSGDINKESLNIIYDFLSD
jgi:predicted glycosyltransferase